MGVKMYNVNVSGKNIQTACSVDERPVDSGFVIYDYACVYRHIHYKVKI